MQSILDNVIANVSRIILGKEDKIKMALTCMLAQGHLLIEDLPGMGKTTLSHALASALGLTYKRIQFTSDMLPGDIIGTNIFDTKTQSFVLHQGPIFTQVLLADEINRSSPKTQSALLEAMEEKQVTIDGRTFSLPEPFFVIATQNPMHQTGTYPLPESQLDRFLMQITLGYPDRDTEKQLYAGIKPRDKIQSMESLLTLAEWFLQQQQASKTHISDSVLAYVQRLVDYTRYSGECKWGLSPRAAVGLVQAAKAWAFIHRREHVLFEDVQAVFSPIVSHRLRAQMRIGSQSDVGRVILDKVDVLG